MENEKDRFGDTMRLVERAKEDIYFAERDRQVLEKLRGQLRKGKPSPRRGAVRNALAGWRVTPLRDLRSIAAMNAAVFGWTEVSSRQSS